YEVKDGPFPSQDAAMAKHGGVLPLNTKLVRSASRGGEPQDSWYLLARNPVVTGGQLRNARAGQDDVRKWETSFSLSPAGGRPVAGGGFNSSGTDCGSRRAGGRDRDYAGLL